MEAQGARDSLQAGVKLQAAHLPRPKAYWQQPATGYSIWSKC